MLCLEPVSNQIWTAFFVHFVEFENTKGLDTYHLGWNNRQSLLVTGNVTEAITCP